MKPRIVKLKIPKPRKCRECKAESEWEFAAGRNSVVATEIEMHHCTCSKSEYQIKRKACLAKGGHFPFEVSAGAHSYFECSNCEQRC